MYLLQVKEESEIKIKTVVIETLNLSLLGPLLPQGSKQVVRRCSDRSPETCNAKLYHITVTRMYIQFEHYCCSAHFN